MSTRCNVGIVNEDGSITAIYCHHDGYIKGPFGVGYTLYNYYNSEDKAQDLVNNGSTSSIKHTLEETIAYDDGFNLHIHFKDIQDYLENAAFDIDYLYLWNDNAWHVFGLLGDIEGWYPVKYFL